MGKDRKIPRLHMRWEERRFHEDPQIIFPWGPSCQQAKFVKSIMWKWGFWRIRSMFVLVPNKQRVRWAKQREGNVNVFFSFSTLASLEFISQLFKYGIHILGWTFRFRGGLQERGGPLSWTTEWLKTWLQSGITHYIPRVDWHTR